MSDSHTSWFDRLAARAQGGPSEIAAILAMSGAGGDIIDFTGGFPDPRLYDTQVISELAAKAISTRPETALQYSSNYGIASLIDTLRADISARQGITPGEGELMVTSGGVDALTLLSLSMFDRGNAVLVEAPSYLGAFSIFDYHDAVCVSMHNDDHGLIPESAAEAAERARTQGNEPKAIYVIPDFQNPSGLLLSAERRQRLVDIAREQGLLIIEDVAYRDLAFDGTYLPSIYSLGPDVTVQIGTFSKTFTPGTRMGWAAGPREIIDALATAKTTTDQCAGALGQCILESMLREGHYDTALTQLRTAYGQRGHALVSALAAQLPELDAVLEAPAAWTVPQGGFFTWVTLPGVDTKAMAPAAIENGVAYVPGQPFFAEGGVRHEIRMSFSRTPIERMEEGIARLIQTVKAL